MPAGVLSARKLRSSDAAKPKVFVPCMREALQYSNACYVSRNLSECARASRRFLRGASVTKLRVIFIIRQRKRCEDASHSTALRAKCHTGSNPLLSAQAKGRSFHFCF